MGWENIPEMSSYMKPVDWLFYNSGCFCSANIESLEVQNKQTYLLDM